MIVHSTLELITEDMKKKEILEDLDSYVKNSYLLIEKIKNTEIKSRQFFISGIVFSEVFSVIGDQYRLEYLKKRNIPVRYWIKMINDVKIPDEYLVQIQEEIDRFYKIFFKTKKIFEIDEFYFDDAGLLIWIYKCNTHDALVLAQAIHGKCDYFITEDRRLRDKLRNMKEYKIKLYSSDRYSKEIFN